MPHTAVWIRSAEVWGGGGGGGGTWSGEWEHNNKEWRQNFIVVSLESVLIHLKYVQILCIGTDRSQQTVQTKIRLLLKKQSDQGLRCLLFHQHFWMH